MNILNNLRDKHGSRSKRKLLGRGIGSGKGKTSGRGGKGQTARSGVAIGSFEGGQQTLYRRLPKRGFNNINRLAFEVVNLQDIQLLISQNKLTSGSKITIEQLKALGIYRGKLPLKVLGKLKDSMSSSFQIEAHAISDKAKSLIEQSGGAWIKINDSRIEKRAAKAEKGLSAVAEQSGL